VRLFCLQIRSKYFRPYKYLANYIIYMQVFMYGIRYLCHVLNKIKIYGQMILKLANIKFSESPLTGSHIVSSGRTDGHSKLCSWYL
jgi:hypothetical protein